jgi:uncharacterized OsmC-like protein/alpha-beta hydrolase superfamily lysophospholipase
MRVTFPNSRGDTLAAVVERPLGDALGWALLAHCFTCGKDLRAARRIGASLVAEGFGVLRFDFTGLGESEGEFADTNFSSNVADLAAAVDYLRAEHEAPVLLIGHSLGGAAVIAAAPQVPEVQAVVTLGAPADPAHVRELIDATAPDLSERGEAEVVLAGRRFRIKEQFLADLEQQDQEQSIANLGCALLVLHAPQDSIVGIDNARRIYQAAKHPKSFVSLDGADHLLSRARDADYVGRLVAAWAARYLPEPPTGVGEEILASTGRRGFATDVAAGPHRLRADEPASVGGTETGPTPYGYLLAALGSCTSMTLRMYADHKKWPLERATVRLRHTKLHASDCADCESAEGRVDQIERELTLEGPLDEAQRQRLLEIADRCPVHRTLHGEIKVRTRLA